MTSPAQHYDPATIETFWQQRWQAEGTFTAPHSFAEGDSRPRKYVLEMFPYPSGDMHMGHVRNYSIGDVHARFARLQGACVLHPMGWDALGLPAENQAIREKVAPQLRTPQNIARMRAQAVRLGLAYDWSREIATYLPEYYRWNQWLFLQLYKKGLVYRRRSTVNFCPGCDTVLANEQVRDDNTCWRGHPGVVQRSIPEWAFRITAYAEELLQGLSTLDQWPERIVAQQRHWLGKSTGATLRFAVAAAGVDVEIFTTRLDTIYGCTFLVLGAEHPAVQRLTTAACKAAVDSFVDKMGRTERSARVAADAAKEGVFTGSYATHPFTGKQIPIWLANFVVGDYGTGAVMSVPAHDARDFAFAQQYGLPVQCVIWPAANTPPEALPYLAEGVLVDSGSHAGMHSAAARTVLSEAAQQAHIGGPSTTWHLRDWGFSRQRYWGTPIPIVYCDQCGTVPVPAEALPVRLPDFADVRLTGEGGAPLGKLPAFFETACPRCGNAARREVETMDTFVDSAWYFTRFLSPTCTDAPFTRAAAHAWLPVDTYVGGPEHAVMHLLYFRFFTRAMRDLGLLDIDEPVRRLITQGMVNATAFRCPEHGYLPAAAHMGKSAEAAACPQCGKTLQVAVEKMSKSKYNGIDPLHLIARYGADTTRLYTLFAAPPEKDLEWNSSGVEGVYRFVGRVWRLLVAQTSRLEQPPPTADAAASAAARRLLHGTLVRVSEEMRQRHHFNTAIAALMELTNGLYELHMHDAAVCQVSPKVGREVLQTVAQMLSPLAPHLAESMWAAGGGAGLVAESRWPEADLAACASQTLQLAVQINGKLRGQVQVASDADRAAAEQAARADANVARYLDGKQLIKCIYVPRRLLNFVVRDGG